MSDLSVATIVRPPWVPGTVSDPSLRADFPLETAPV